jgi:hypothetical protein
MRSRLDDARRIPDWSLARSGAAHPRSPTRPHAQLRSVGITPIERRSADDDARNQEHDPKLEQLCRAVGQPFLIASLQWAHWLPRPRSFSHAHAM